MIPGAVKTARCPLTVRLLTAITHAAVRIDCRHAGIARESLDLVCALRSFTVSSTRTWTPLTTTVHTRFMLADDDETSQENSDLVLTSGDEDASALASCEEGSNNELLRNASFISGSVTLMIVHDVIFNICY